MSKTHITILADRTGSMSLIAQEASVAINKFIEDQAKIEEDATLLLADFDNMDPFRVYFDCKLNEATEYEIDARGMTPLHDAIGKGILETDKKISKDDKVFFVIQTDGEENCSKEFNKDSVNTLIKDREKDGWEFVFLAAGPDAWEASHMYAGTRMVDQNLIRASGTATSYAAGTQSLSTTMTGLRTSSSTTTATFADDTTDEG